MKLYLYFFIFFTFTSFSLGAEKDYFIAGKKPLDIAPSCLFLIGGFVFHNFQINESNPLLESDKKSYIKQTIPELYVTTATLLSSLTPFILDKKKGLHHFRGALFAGSSNFFLYSLTSTLVGRHRPNFDAALAIGEKAEKKSFYSGHTTMSFSTATYTSLYLLNYYDSSPLSWAATVGLFSLSSYVAYTRWNEHYHHTSDIIAGAVIGTAISYFTFQLYENRRKQLFQVTASPASFNVALNF